MLSKPQGHSVAGRLQGKRRVFKIKIQAMKHCAAFLKFWQESPSALPILKNLLLVIWYTSSTLPTCLKLDSRHHHPQSRVLSDPVRYIIYPRDNQVRLSGNWICFSLLVYGRKAGPNLVKQYLSYPVMETDPVLKMSSVRTQAGQCPKL
jgi:hypothetical protein